VTAYLATHVVDVLTGTTATDDYGDATDGATVAAANVAVSIMERARRTSRYGTDSPRTIRELAGRAPHGTPVRQGDRLRDTGSTAVWVVDGITQQSNPILTPDLVLELRRIDGT
jgi:hypothetical protein